MKKLLTFLLVAGFAAVTFAQQPEAPKKDGAKKFFEAHKVLKEKYPEEMKAIAELRKEAFKKNMEAERKFAELAQKEKMDLPCVKKLERMQKFEAFNKKYAKELEQIKADRKAGWEAEKKFRELLKKEGIEFPKKDFRKDNKKGPQARPDFRKGDRKPDFRRGGKKGPEGRRPDFRRGDRKGPHGCPAHRGPDCRKDGKGPQGCPPPPPAK